MSVCMLRQTQGWEVMGTDWFLSGYNERVRSVTLEPARSSRPYPPPPPTHPTTLIKPGLNRPNQVSNWSCFILSWVGGFA